LVGVSQAQAGYRSM